MNEPDATPLPLSIPRSPAVKVATALHDVCSFELGAAVLARRDERIY